MRREMCRHTEGVRRVVPFLISFLALAGCGADTGFGSSAEGVTAAVGYGASVEIEGLQGPTQIAWIDDELLVAEISGGENDGTGRVSRMPIGESAASSNPVVLFTELDKPTGVAFFDDRVWVMEATRLSQGSDGKLVSVAEDLPNNGRSQGTLTVTPDDRLLFDTSGSKSGGDVVAGSGRLFQVQKASSDPQEIASGFKHAYAHTVDADGRLWATEMTDGRFDGEPAPDEVVGVVEGADHGWPHCVGDNRVVAEFDGSAERCAVVPASLAVFEPGATPTSIVVAPWDDAVLLVALWNRGQLVEIRTDQPRTQIPAVVASGLQNPQHLLVDGETVLLAEFGTGRILRIERG